jgi:hypothetical protein
MLKQKHLYLLFCLIVFASSGVSAQSPVPAATSLSDPSKGGFLPGWTLGVRFEGSSSSDGSVYDLGSAVGRNFTRHFGVDFGVPFYFIGTPSSIKKSNPNAVSGVGIGSFFSDLRFNYPDPFLNYASTVHLTAPTGDTEKGLSVGHATWNFSNHIDHAFGDFSPILNLGVGNTVLDTRYFHHPYMSFGYNAQSEAGLEYDPGKFSFSASAYDVAPWGNQTIYSRVFRCGGPSCSSGSGRNGFKTSNVTSGGADLVRDNGWNAGIDYKPSPRIDLEFDYSRSVPLHLNNYSFGMGFDLSSLLNGNHRAL